MAVMTMKKRAAPENSAVIAGLILYNCLKLIELFDIFFSI